MDAFVPIVVRACLCFLCLGLAGRLREMMALPNGPQLVLVNIPDDGAFYLGQSGSVTAESAAQLITDYEAKALARKQLKK